MLISANLGILGCRIFKRQSLTETSYARELCSREETTIFCGWEIFFPTSTYPLQLGAQRGAL